jgi:uncharacterized protein involved in outer membrane biogenesis
VLKKVLVGGVALALVVATGLFFWARAVLTQDTVRTALAAQLSKAIGQPVTVGSIDATIYPRLAVNLGAVSIGEPPRVHVQTLRVGTDFRALLSRRIEHASVRLTGARVELPLPPLTIASASGPPPAGAPGSSPVEIVSIDEIVLNGVEIVSGGRTLRGDIEAVPEGHGILLRKMALTADDTSISITGRIVDLAGPSGQLAIVAGMVNVDKLLAFVNNFSSGAGPGQPHTAPSPAAPAAAPPMNLSVSLEAKRATLGTLVIDKLVASAVVKGDDVAVNPLAFGVFGGRYEGKAGVTLGSDQPSFRWSATVSGIDVAAAAAFAGSPNTISGRMSGRIDLAGRGADAANAMKTARGTTRVEIANGVVTNLGLVRAAVAATSLNTGSLQQAVSASRDEPFSKISATLAIAGGTATTQDFLFESKDLTLTAQGTARLDGSAVNLKGQARLSEELSRQAGTGIMRAAQENGRVTLPATISGPSNQLSVRVDAADMAKRAITNEVNDQTQKMLKKGLSGFLHR